MVLLRMLGNPLAYWYRRLNVSNFGNFRGGCALLMPALLLLFTSLSSRLCAQTNPTSSTAASKRYLFIVETSRAMQRRSQGTVETMKSFLDSSLKGHMRQGDTLGIWTFNEELYTNWLPFEEWSSQGQLTIAVRVASFLHPE